MFDIGDIKEYVSLITLVAPMVATAFAFTPKGFKVATAIYNWLSVHYFHADIYKRIGTWELKLKTHRHSTRSTTNGGRRHLHRTQPSRPRKAAPRAPKD